MRRPSGCRDRRVVNEEATSVDHAARWDEMYSERDQHWSGEPNGALVAEVADLEAGTALDVGCGEGADAIWLASRGWQVTGLDVSAVAIGRAEQAARATGASIDWIVGDLVDSVPSGQKFDLVALSYPALPTASASESVGALLEATAPGGTLLVVGHDVEGSDHFRKHAAERGFDPDDFVQPPDIAARLDNGWTIEVNETRPRITPPGFDGPDIDDVVLRARRGASPG